MAFDGAQESSSRLEVISSLFTLTIEALKQPCQLVCLQICLFVVAVVVVVVTAAVLVVVVVD
jgi:hypothetical protein